MGYKEQSAGVEAVRDGRNLFVRRCQVGDEAQAVSLQLVLVHGTCSTEEQYHAVLHALDRQVGESHVKIRIDCLLYDFMGCNRSPILTDWDAYDNSESVSDLEALVAKYTSDSAPVVIVGHSYGPTIILKMLQKRPIPNLVGCIFIGTSVRNKDLAPADGGHPLMYLPVFLLNCLQKAMTNAFVEMAIHPDHAVLKEVVRKSSDGNDMGMAKGYHRHMKFATEEDLDVVRSLPALVVHGVDDGVISVKCGQHLANQLPKSKLVVVEKASHLVTIEQPDEVAQAVLRFLQTLHLSQN